MTLSPRADQHTEAIIEEALESLTNLRGLPCPDDPGVRLHTLASLVLQIHTTLAAAVLEARRHDYGYDEIAAFTGNTASATEPQREEVLDKILRITPVRGAVLTDSR